MRYYCQSFCVMSSEFADPTRTNNKNLPTSGNINIGVLSEVLILLKCHNFTYDCNIIQVTFVQKKLVP